MSGTKERNIIKKIEVSWQQDRQRRSVLVPVYRGDTLSDFAREARKLLQIGDEVDLSLPEDIRGNPASELGDNEIPLTKDGWVATIRGNIAENKAKQTNSIFGPTGKIEDNKATGEDTEQKNTIQNQSQGCCML